MFQLDCVNHSMVSCCHLVFNDKVLSYTITSPFLFFIVIIYDDAGGIMAGDSGLYC